MIPVRLCIEGIYSYRERAEIDFKRLCDARLFGIFGPVGSGKSTILEAITFALYGETERMNSREGRSYNMMNLKSSRLWIDFEFQAGEAGTERYRFTVELKRNSKDFSNVGTPKRLAFKWDGGEWMPLPETKAECIIGISYDNFIKTVIIPQGRFQDFLGMSTTDRTRMLKELFDLQRFDLATPTKKLLESTNSTMENIRGRMGENKPVSQEELDALAEHRLSIEQQLRVTLQAQKETESAIHTQAQAKELSLEIEQLKAWIQSREAEAAGIEAREKHLKRYADSDGQLRDLMEAEEKFIQAHETATQQGTALNVKLKETNPQLEAAETRFHDAKLAVDQREALEAQSRDMMAMSKMRQKENEIRICEERIANGNKTLESQKSIVAETKAKIQAKDLTVEVLKQELPDLHSLMDLLQWHTSKAALEHQREISLSAQKESQQKIEESEESLKIIAPGGLAALETERTALNAQVDFTRAHLDRLRTHKRLVEFAAQLHDGEACPLCGSTEHPHPMSESDNEEAFETENNKLKSLEAEISSNSEKIRQFLSNQDRLNDRIQLFEKSKLVTNDLNAQISQHDSLHHWPEKANWTMQETQNAYNDAKIKSEILKKTSEELEILKNTLQTQESDLQKFINCIQKIESEQNEHRAVLHSFASQIDLAQYEALKPQPDTFFIAEAERCKLEIARAQKAFIEAESQVEQLRKQVQSLETEIRLSLQHTETLRSQISETAEKLQNRMQVLDFSTREEVATLLNQRLDIERERREIDLFRQEMIEKKATLNAKNQALGMQQYDELLYQQLLHQQKENQDKIALFQQETGKIDNQVKLLIEQQQRHAALQKELDALELRYRDLKVMEGLFKADGFVNWVSKVYLKELCHRANLRFQTLTRNRLSLEISDDNAFLVRDMVNDGQTRSVKTLSGGQTFQAALCLALALADNIHARNQHLHNFFFLDEGFGSLDRDSLQVVFDTLKSLQRENRVVGVISHVEEMQQEIDVALRIVVDEERGSLVREI